MDNHVLKITGVSELPEPLQMRTEYLLSVKAGINEIRKKDNEDGTFTYTYPAKQISVEVLKKTGEIIKTKDFTKQSQRMRLAIENLRPDGIDKEIFYQDTMNNMRRFLPEILEFIKRK